MKKVIDNEGKSVMIPESLYNELKQEFDKGTWGVMIKVDGQPHMIIIPDNF